MNRLLRLFLALILAASGLTPVAYAATSPALAPTGRVTLSVSSSSSRVALGSVDGTACVRNSGATNDAYVAFGGSTIAADTTSGVVIPAGWEKCFASGNNTYIAAITASSTTTLDITTGAGVPALTGGGGGGGATGVAQGSTTSGQTGGLTQAAVTTASPSYTTGQTSPLSLDTSGNLRVNVVTGGASGYAQGSTTSGQLGALLQGAATTAPAAYTTGSTNPLPLSASGAVWTTPIDTSASKVQGNDTIGAALTVNPVVTGSLDGSNNVQADVEITATTDSTGVGIRAVGLTALFDDVSPPARTENQVAPVRETTNGAMLAKLDATDAETWTYVAPAAGIMSNTTTAVTIKASCGANLRNHVKQIDVSSIGAIGAATTVALRDGASGTVLWRIPVGTAGLTTPFAKVFSMPLLGTAATLLEVVTETADTSGAFIVNAQGYCSR